MIVGCLVGLRGRSEERAEQAGDEGDGNSMN